MFEDYFSESCQCGSQNKRNSATVLIESCVFRTMIPFGAHKTSAVRQTGKSTVVVLYTQLALGGRVEQKKPFCY